MALQPHASMHRLARAAAMLGGTAVHVAEAVTELARGVELELAEARATAAAGGETEARELSDAVRHSLPGMLTMRSPPRFDKRVWHADDAHGWWALQLQLLGALPGRICHAL